MPDQLILTGLDPKKLSIKLDFKKPELVSMSSQSESDQIIIKWRKDFVLNDVNGNSLVLDDGLNTDDSVDVSLPI